MTKANPRRPVASGGRAAKLFRDAVAARQAGALDDAERLYRESLALDPRNLPARHDLGVMLLRRQQPAEAAAELQQVVTMQPGHAHGWLNLGLARSEAGQQDAARVAASRSVRLDPRLAPAQAALGYVLSRSDDLPGAAAAYRTAIALDPAAAPVRLQYATLLRRMGDAAAALDEVDRFVADHPRDAQAHAERGTTLATLGRIAEAETAFRVAVEHDGPDFEAVRRLCAFLVGLGRVADALASIDEAVVRHPSVAVLHRERSRHRRRVGDLAGALSDLQAALALSGDDPTLLFETGDVLYQGCNFEAATAAYLAVIEMKPDWAEAYGKLVATRAAIGDFGSWLPLLRHAAALAPHRLGLATDVLLARQNDCDWDGLEAEFERTRLRCIEAGEPFSPFTLLGFGVPATEFRLWTQAWAERHAPPAAPKTSYRRPIPRAAGARARVGYLSADFWNHATATLVAELFALHDRRRFEVIGYNIGPRDASPMGQRMIEALDGFVDLTLLSDADAAGRIAEDDLDILIDLKGYTNGARVGILAHRPAPIQVNYLGFPGTMGTPLVDYIVADAVVAPTACREEFSEAVVHLPHCYQPNDRERPGPDPAARRAEHGLPDEGFVFCCLCTNYKIVPLVFEVWMRLLRDTPGSVLWLLQSTQGSRDNLIKAAAGYGIGAERLVFAPRVALPRHMARLGLADLFLDTLPVTAHTTASEALWAGLPLLTVMGPSFASRVAASLLTTMGVPDLAMPDLSAYEREAAALARDPARLQALRDRIATNRLSSPLFDTPRYVRNFEAALERMVELRDMGRPPEPFSIADQGCEATGPDPGPSPSVDDLLARVDALIDPRTVS